MSMIRWLCGVEVTDNLVSAELHDFRVKLGIDDIIIVSGIESHLYMWGPFFGAKCGKRENILAVHFIRLPPWNKNINPHVC